MPLSPAYLGNDPYLFVSYAHLDDTAVMPEIEWPNLNRFNVWYDEGVSGGSEWREEIAIAVQPFNRSTVQPFNNATKDKKFEC
jgi:hypothetical protein